MSRATNDEFLDNFSFVVRDDRTCEIGYIKIKDFFENIEVIGEEE